MLYIVIIALSDIIIALVSIALGNAVFMSVCNTLCSTASIILLDGLFAFLIRRLPQKWFDETSALCNVSKREQKFLRSLHIVKWEKHIPELGLFTGFHKRKMENSNSYEYLQRFLLETNYGAIIHLSNALFGFLIVWIPYTGSYIIQVPVIFVNFILSMLPFFILRHNTLPLKRLVLKRKFANK